MGAHSGNCNNHLHITIRSEVLRMDHVHRGILVTDRLWSRNAVLLIESERGDPVRR